MSRKSLVAFAILGVLASSSARASTLIDLTSSGSTGTGTADIGGNFGVAQISPQSTGTGVIDSFLRVQEGTSEQGYNTTLGGNPLDDKGGNFTRALLLSEVPIVTIGGVNYREFMLDVNQTVNNLIDLNQIQILQGTADPSGTATLTAGTATNPPAITGFTGGNSSGNTFTTVFQMSNTGSGTPNFDIRLNYALNSGSGSGDMFLFVPDADFNVANSPFVILYSQFGTPPGTNGSNDGFEEWAVVKTLSPTQFCVNPNGCDVNPPAPEPASLFLLGTGLAVVARQVRRRKRRQ